MISFDTESLGLDVYHGARPFFITTCDEQGHTEFWQWDVDPLTRNVLVDENDLDEVHRRLTTRETDPAPAPYRHLLIKYGLRPDTPVGILLDRMRDSEDPQAEALADFVGQDLVAQNSKFDVAMIRALFKDHGRDITWDWKRTQDTLIAGHLLASNRKHDLTAMAIQYLGRDISKWEKDLEVAVKKARSLCTKHLKDWRIAKAGLEDMPSAKEKTWKYDSWLPATICSFAQAGGAVTLGEGDWWHEYSNPDHPWNTVLREYANTDSAITIALWGVMSREIRRRGLESIYDISKKKMELAHDMEWRGLTMIKPHLNEIDRKYAKESERAGDKCLAIATKYNYELELPKSGNNNSLKFFCFGRPVEGNKLNPVSGRGIAQRWLDLPVVGYTDGGEPSMDKKAMEEYQTRLERGSDQWEFIQNLAAKRRRDTARVYMQGYQRFWLRIEEFNDAKTDEQSKREGKEDTCETDEQDRQDGNVLELDGGEVQERGIRPTPRARAVQSSQDQLYTSHRSNTKKSLRSPQVRQHGVRQPETPILRNTQRQLEGYDAEGKAGGGDKERIDKIAGKAGQGRATPHDISNRRTGTRDKSDVHQVQQDIGVCSIGSEIWLKESNHSKNYARSHLGTCTSFADFYVIHPSLSPTGTDTLRWSSQNPNSQNISKQGMMCLYCFGDGDGNGIEADGKGMEGKCLFCRGKGVDPKNLRYCFGPLPGWEWWSLDAKNIELRIPFYKAGEQELINLFERPDEPPYYGSNHLLNFQVIYPDIWNGEMGKVCNDGCCKGKTTDITLIGPHCKKKFASTWYQYCKNGNFAVQYGAQERKADATYKRKGAFLQIQEKFKNLAAYNRKITQFATRHGYVETIPDRSVDPKRGYPLLCTRTENGTILPTVPLSYHVQGSAMWWTFKAMLRVEEKLKEWRKKGFVAYIVMQVHDELVIAMPRRGDPSKWDRKNQNTPENRKIFFESNLWRIEILRKLMAKGGEDFDLPTPVGAEYHANNWGEGVTLA